MHVDVMGRKYIKILCFSSVLLIVTGFYVIFLKESEETQKTTIKRVTKHHYVKVDVQTTRQNNANATSMSNKTSVVAVIQIPNGILSMIQEIEKRHEKLTGHVTVEDVQITSCKPGGSPINGVEDLLCMTPPKFSPLYKNPCWTSPDKHFQCLPYFQIIGMDKSGSTDLFDRIAMHPDVTNNSGTLGKETQWWSWKRYGLWLKSDLKKKLSFSKYISYFNSAAKKIRANITAGIVTGDGTPMDLWDFRGWPLIPQNPPKGPPTFLTPHLIKHVNPNVKLIVILRNPVERLFSDYFFLGLGKMSAQAFHVNLLKSIEMLRNCIRKMSLRMCLYSKDFHKKVPVRIHLGFYSIYLREWFKVFPREQFHILRTEDYSTNMRQKMGDIFKFLDLRDISNVTMKKVLTSSKKHVTKRKKKATMLPESRAIAERLYQTFNQELATLLNDEMYYWQLNKL